MDEHVTREMPVTVPRGKPPRWRRWGATAIMVIAALIVGISIGSGTGRTTVRTVAGKTVYRTVSAPAPTVTVTASAQPAPTVTVTQTAQAQSGSGGSQSGNSSGGQSGSTQVVARFNGTGDQNTGTFTVPDTWHLSWSYWGCASSPSNFIVDEYNSDGTPDANGVNVNELGSGRGPVATYAYGDGGTHYFSVNTEGCSWSLAVVTGG